MYKKQQISFRDILLFPDQPINIMQNKKNESKAIDRRSFLRKSAIAGAAFTSIGIEGSKIVQAKTQGNKSTKITSYFPFRVIEHSSIDDILTIQPDYKRMHQKNTIFSRSAWDPEMGFGDGKGTVASFMAVPHMIPDAIAVGKEKGWGPVEQALSDAAVFSHNAGTGFSAMGMRNAGPFCDWDVFAHPHTKEKYQFKSPEEANKYIKRAVQFLGASDVGIAPYDQRWIYSHWFNIAPIMGIDIENVKKPIQEVETEAKFPFEVKSVIVTVHRMDHESLMTPGYIMNSSTMDGYSKMAEVGAKVAMFLNSLGYKAIPAGNDTGLSVPTALQAGLGESSRMGLLVHPKFGPAVRIEKIYTDLEIAPDKPITFGVKEFCKKCMKCADECPSNAISREIEPTPAPNNPSISSHPGVTKWYQDNEKCIEQWEKMGYGCGICLAVCPYNKPENWVHDVAKLAVGMPVGRDIARILDDSFGYGKLDPDKVDKFWNDED
ncbi:reductive dehalogenase [Prolixibacteraceae bacterium JC049]|nr:reductive dehalogenase [Prolixibacteraceae bacterium JC049]